MIDDDPHYNPDAPFARRGEFYHTGKEGTRAMTIPDSVTLAQASAFKAAYRQIDAHEKADRDHVKKLVEQRLGEAQAMDDWATFALLTRMLMVYIDQTTDPEREPPRPMPAIVTRLTDALDAVGEGD